MAHASFDIEKDDPFGGAKTGSSVTAFGAGELRKNGDAECGVGTAFDKLATRQSVAVASSRRVLAWFMLRLEAAATGCGFRL